MELGNVGMIQESAHDLHHKEPSSSWIFKVLRDVSPNCLNPQPVSNRPLHREDVSVQVFEEENANLEHRNVNMDQGYRTPGINWFLPSSDELVSSGPLHKEDVTVQTFEEENDYLELGNVDKDQDSDLQSLGMNTEASSYFEEESGNPKLDVGMIQESVQSLLHRVHNGASHTESTAASIFMVPSVLRDVNPRCFTPQMLSIGPLHREDDIVQAFECQKVTYLIKLMSHIPFIYPQENVLELCMQKAYTSMSEIKACYKVWPKTYTDAEIAEMMVVDACFILGYLLEFSISRTDDTSPGSLAQSAIIDKDLMLLENQIPMFFLDEIFQCTILKCTGLSYISNISLYKLIHPLIDCFRLFEEDLRIDSGANVPHILGILQQCYAPPDTIEDDFNGPGIRSAIDMDMAGVNFEPRNDPTAWVMGMEVKQYHFLYFFGSWGKPTLTMPIFSIHDSSEFILRNLIAYERLCRVKKCVTSYAVAMDMLVNTHEDVAKLVKSRVLVNLMGSHKEAANLINSICKNVSPHFFYKGEWEKLNKYCSGYWPKHITLMRGTYFSSPWSIIALIGGIILFVLQVVQTIFTIKSSGSNK